MISVLFIFLTLSVDILTLAYGKTEGKSLVGKITSECSKAGSKRKKKVLFVLHMFENQRFISPGVLTGSP